MFFYCILQDLNVSNMGCKFKQKYTTQEGTMDVTWSCLVVEILLFLFIYLCCVMSLYICTCNTLVYCGLTNFHWYYFSWLGGKFAVFVNIWNCTELMFLLTKFVFRSTTNFVVWRHPRKSRKLIPMKINLQ